MSDNQEMVVKGKRVRRHEVETGKQIKRTGKIKENSVGSEVIIFDLFVDQLHPDTKKLIFVVNVPPEGKDTAPTYIKQTAG